MKHLGCFFLLLFAPLFSQAQEWQPTNGPSGGYVWELQRAADNTVFAVAGWLGSIGLYRSTDAGQTWTAIPGPTLEGGGYQSWDGVAVTEAGDVYVPDPGGEATRLFWLARGAQRWHELPAPGTAIYDMVLHEGDLWAGTTQGVYRSRAGAASWEPMGLAEERVYDLYRTASGRLFAEHEYALYEWQNDQWTQRLALGQGLGIATIEEDLDGSLLLGMVDFDYQSEEPAGLYRLSTDGSLMLVGLEGLAVLSLVRDPAGTLYAGTSLSYGNLQTIYRQRGGASQWEPVGGVGASVHQLLCLDDGTLLAGTHGFLLDAYIHASRGVMRSVDQGTTWQLPVAGLPHADTYAMASSIAHLYAAADQSVFRSNDRGATWKAIFTASRAATHPYPPLYNVVVHPDGDVIVQVLNVGFFRSSDAGVTWEPLGPAEAVPETEYETYRPEALAVTPGGTLLLGERDGVFRSVDKGDTWDIARVGEKEDTAIALIADNAGRAFAVLRNYDTHVFTVYTSTDEGATWVWVTDFETTDWSGQINVAVGATGALWVSTGEGHLLRLHEEAGGWMTQEPAPNAPEAADLLVDAHGTVYMATLDGVVRSRVTADGFWVWEPMQAGEGPRALAFVQTLHLDESGYLYAGTRSAGVFRTAKARPTSRNPAPEVPRTAELNAPYPNPFREQTTIPFTLAQPGPVTLVVYDVLGREVARLVQGVVLPAGSHERTWQTEGLGSGVYWVQLRTGGGVETQQVVLLP